MMSMTISCFCHSGIKYGQPHKFASYRRLSVYSAAMDLKRCYAAYQMLYVNFLSKDDYAHYKPILHGILVEYGLSTTAKIASR